MKPTKRKGPYFLSPEDRAKLLTKLAKEPSPVNALIELLVKTGARCSELLAVTREDVNEQKKSVLIHGLKGSNDREIFLREETFTLLMSLFEKTSKIEISYKTLQRAWYKVRPVNRGLHCLRHTYAVNLYDTTRNTILVKKALGHKSINSTMVYVDLIDTEEQMKKVAL